MIALTLWRNYLDSTGTPWSLESWDDLFERLSRVEGSFLGEAEHPGWSPASFRGNHRSKEDARQAFALGLDYDGGTAEQTIRERFGEFFGIAHATRKSTPDAPRWRVVLPFARPVSGFEYAELWKRLPAWVGEVDTATKDISRFWYLPGSATGSEHRSFLLGGDKMLDPDEWLQKPAPSVERARPQFVFNPRADQQAIERRAIAYIAKMPHAVAKEGGHMALWHVALTLAKGFALGEERTLAILKSEYNHRCEPPWSDKELEHKAEHAAKAKVPDGYKLADDWRRTVEYAAACAPPERQREPGEDDDQEPELPPVEEARAAPKVVSLRSMFLEVWELAKTGKRVDGFTTGIGDVDALMCGLRRKHVSIVAAPTSWGKSSLAVMIADENILKGERILIVSAEDPSEMYAKRWVARRLRMNAMNLRDNDLKKTEIDRLGVAAVRLGDEPVFYEAIGKPVEDVAEEIAKLVAQEGFGLVLCDYLQCFRARQRTQDRRNEVTLVARLLSDAIKLSNAAGVMFSQFKRIEGREPTMDDVKESGDLENMAEHVLLGHKKPAGQPYYEGEARAFVRQIKIAKNKDGPVLDNWIDCKFNDITASFEATPRTEAPKRADPWDGVAEDRY